MYIHLSSTNLHVHQETSDRNHTSKSKVCGASIVITACRESVAIRLLAEQLPRVNLDPESLVMGDPVSSTTTVARCQSCQERVW